METKIPSSEDIAKAIPSVQDVKSAMPSMDDVRKAMPTAEDVRNALPSAEDVRRAMPRMDDIRDALPDADDFKLPGGNDFMRTEVLGGAALVAAAFFLPPVWRVAAGVVGGALIGYGLFVEHGPRYPSERHGREYYSTYGRRRGGPDEDDLIDSMSMDSFPTSDPPATY